MSTRKRKQPSKKDADSGSGSDSDSGSGSDWNTEPAAKEPPQKKQRVSMSKAVATSTASESSKASKKAKESKEPKEAAEQNGLAKAIAESKGDTAAAALADGAAGKKDADAAASSATGASSASGKKAAKKDAAASSAVKISLRECVQKHCEATPTPAFNATLGPVDLTKQAALSAETCLVNLKVRAASAPTKPKENGKDGDESGADDSDNDVDMSQSQTSPSESKTASETKGDATAIKVGTILVKSKRDNRQKTDNHIFMSVARVPQEFPHPEILAGDADLRKFVHLLQPCYRGYAWSLPASKKKRAAADSEDGGDSADAFPDMKKLDMTAVKRNQMHYFFIVKGQCVEILEKLMTACDKEARECPDYMRGSNTNLYSKPLVAVLGNRFANGFSIEPDCLYKGRSRLLAADPISTIYEPSAKAIQDFCKSPVVYLEKRFQGKYGVNVDAYKTVNEQLLAIARYLEEYNPFAAFGAIRQFVDKGEVAIKLKRRDSKAGKTKGKKKDKGQSDKQSKSSSGRSRSRSRSRSPSRERGRGRPKKASSRSRSRSSSRSRSRSRSRSPSESRSSKTAKRRDQDRGFGLGGGPDRSVAQMPSAPSASVAQMELLAKMATSLDSTKRSADGTLLSRNDLGRVFGNVDISARSSQIVMSSPQWKQDFDMAEQYTLAIGRAASGVTERDRATNAQVINDRARVMLETKTEMADLRLFLRSVQHSMEHTASTRPEALWAILKPFRHIRTFADLLTTLKELPSKDGAASAIMAMCWLVSDRSNEFDCFNPLTFESSWQAMSTAKKR